MRTKELTAFAGTGLDSYIGHQAEIVRGISDRAAQRRNRSFNNLYRTGVASIHKRGVHTFPAPGWRREVPAREVCVKLKVVLSSMNEGTRITKDEFKFLLRMFKYLGSRGVSAKPGSILLTWPSILRINEMAANYGADS